MAKPTTAYIALGSNLGDRETSIRSAIKMLNHTNGTKVARISDIVETAPLAKMNQPDYLNAVAEVKTSLNAEDLHEQLLHIETSLGRVKKEKWSPRIIDLDLLLFDKQVINLPHLTVPHPRMHLRSFVLSGLCQLNAELLHPVIKEPISELAARLGNADFVPNPNLPQLVSIAGIIGVGKTTLAEKLSNSLGCKVIFEPYDANPFLSDVYAGKKELALDSQLFFLAGRTTQLNPDTLTHRQIVISDYIFNKELIYARQLLNSQQLALYEQVYPSLAAKVAAPVLVIYLTDSPQNCLHHIHKRNRPYEQAIKKQFLKALSSDYDRLFAGWKTCPVIRKQMSNFNYTKKTNIDHLANQIKYYVAGPPVIASPAPIRHETKLNWCGTKQAKMTATGKP